MGLVVKINAFYDWECVYFVQTLDNQEAKKKAYKLFKQSVSCVIPDSLEDAEKSSHICIEIIAKIDHVLI